MSRPQLPKALARLGPIVGQTVQRRGSKGAADDVLGDISQPICLRNSGPRGPDPPLARLSYRS